VVVAEVILADAASWATAGGTIAAAAVAILALIFAVRAFRQQSQQLRVLEAQEWDRQLDGRRASASLVFASLVFAWATNAFVASRFGGRETLDVTVRLVNQGTAPVWDCAVVVLSDRMDCPKARTVTWLDLVPPGEASDVPPPLKIRRVQLPDDFAALPPVEISFRDAAGVVWRRVHEGLLTEIVGEQRPPEATYDDWTRATTRTRPSRRPDRIVT
jgi:hypothetical protein